MKKILMYVPVLVMALCIASCQKAEHVTAPETLSNYVNPLIGSAHCRWFHVAPGSLPFGLAKPGPSTNGSEGNPSGWEATGYDYRHTTIEGFPCLHEFQVGGIVLMATNGELITVPGKRDTQEKGYRSAFSHEEEKAMPGYYSVHLKDYGIQAEMTATQRVAYQRFTFPEKEQSHLLFDIGNQQGESGPSVDSEVTITEDGNIEGWVKTLPHYINKYQHGATLTMYFSAEVDRKPESYGTFLKGQTFAGQKNVKGVGAGAYLTYNTKEGEQVTAKVGLSYTSVENARLNRVQETNDGKLSFEQVRAESAKTWENYLGRIRVSTPNEADKVKFYTGLYHAILGRGLVNDINGAYPKNDGTIGQLPLEADGTPKFSFYNTDAIWGGQWNLVQLWAMAYPRIPVRFREYPPASV